MPKITRLILLACFLTACGTRGPLVPPPGKAPEPLLGQAPSPDVNTTKERS